MNNPIIIAIDGPVGSGKGTLSLALSKRLGILYLYTGGMYRALTLACQRKGVDLSDEEEVMGVFLSSDLHLKVKSGDTTIYLGEEDVTDEIVRPEVSNQTPIVAMHPKVRSEMVRRQQEIVKGYSVVIEGRDIASTVAPLAQVKIFLTASLETRAKRRFEQFRLRGIHKTYEDVLFDTEKRDHLDASRADSPLEKQADMIEIDTTDDTVGQTVEKVMGIIKERVNND